MIEKHQTIALFSTCLVELTEPEIAVASLRLLRTITGLEVVSPPQSCCGQPNFNAGDLDGAAQLAKGFIQSFEHFDAVIVPSGSCAATIIYDYIELFDRRDEAQWLERASALAENTYELASYLSQFDPAPLVNGTSAEKLLVSYHDSCSGLRKLGVKQAPRDLLAHTEKVEVREIEQAEVCCGFGGAFCVKQPEISAAMADDKLSALSATGVQTLLAGDWGCLLHLQTRADKLGLALSCRHFAPVLAEMMDLMPKAENAG